MATEEELEEARRRNAEALRAAGGAAYPNDFRALDPGPRARAMALLTGHKIAATEGESIVERRGSLVLVKLADGSTRERFPQDDELTGDEPIHCVYGRVVGKRGPFLVIQNQHGRTQAYLPNKGDGLTEHERAELAAIDLADHVAVEGPLMGTKKGDSALKVIRYRHVGKSLLPPPEKWHGLKDVERRYRERYVDLFANTEVADVFRARGAIVQRLRRFLDERGFLEVETPILQSIRGGATAKPFATHHNALDIALFLRVAPELYLKRLLVGGLDRVYELGRNFRNEGVSTRHNPEFTMLEFYMAYATYEDLIEIAQELLRFVEAGLDPRWREGRSFALDEPFVVVRMTDAILERVRRDDLGPTPFSAITASTLADHDQLASICEAALPSLEPSARKALVRASNHGERIYALFELTAEPALEKMYRTKDGAKSLPVFITHFPFEVSPLARRSDKEPDLTDRFELFVEGREIVNAFSELNDPDDQAARFRAQLENRAKGDEEAMDFDADYIRALMHGMPPAAGFGLGVDRLCMALCNQPSIRDVLLFPAMRPEVS